MLYNEAGFHRLLKMQGIILIAQVITVSRYSMTYKILLAWNPDHAIQFYEVYHGEADDVSIVLESDLMASLCSVWESKEAFKCRSEHSHVFPPGCLLVRVKDPKNEIRKKCPLFLTTHGLNVEELLRFKPNKWQEQLAYVHAQGNRSAEHVVHLLMKMFPGIKEPATESHGDKIMLAIKCYNMRKSPKKNGALRWGRFIMDPEQSGYEEALKMHRDVIETEDTSFLNKIYARCCYDCTGQKVDPVVKTLHLRKHEENKDIDKHLEYFQYSLVTKEDLVFLKKLDDDNYEDEPDTEEEESDVGW